MTERNLAIRLTVLDGGKVKAELREIGEQGEKSLKRIELAGQPSSRALLAMNAAANDVKGSVKAMAGELGPLGSALTAIGPAGLAVGAALAIVTLGLKKGLEAASEAERAYNRLQTVLNATGHASGLTAGFIAAAAEGIEKSTLATAEQVEDAAAVLATFRSVAGDTFTRTLMLAQDMAAVFGGDLNTRVTQLGKALEDPVEGLSALTRVGINFTQTQKDLIQSLVETGQQAEAQKIILDALAERVGGGGAAEAKGLAGATNRLSDAWSNLLKEVGQTPAVAHTAESALGKLSSMLEELRDVVKEDSFGDQVMQANKRLLAAEDLLDDLRRNSLYSDDQQIGIQQRRVTQLKAELDKLLADAKEKAQAFSAEQKRAEAGQEQAARDRRTELLGEQRKKLDETFDRLMTEPAERIAKVNKELETTKRRLESLREKDGSNDAAVNEAIEKAQAVARRQISTIEKPALDAAKRAAEANGKVVDDLDRQMTRLADKRAAFIQDALSRLSSEASTTQRKEVERLAAALYDEGEAQKTLNELQEEGEQVTKSTQTATEVYADEIERLKELLVAGAITQETYNRAVANAQEKQLAASKDAAAGATRAFRAYREQAEDTASMVEKVFTDAMTGTEDAIVELVNSGGRSLKSLSDLVNSVMNDLLRMTVRKSITEPLFNSLESGGFGDFLRGLLPFEQGGVMTSMGALPLHKYAAGGVANSPQIALFGEGRKPEAYVPLPDGRTIPVTMQGGGSVFNVIINNNAGAKVATQEQPNATGGRDLIVQLDEMNARLFSDPGSRSSRVLARAGGLASR